METKVIKIKLKERKLTSFEMKYHELMRLEEASKARLKQGELYNLEALATKLGMNEPDYEWKQLTKEIEDFKKAEYVKRIKYWDSDEGLLRLDELKQVRPLVEQVNGFSL